MGADRAKEIFMDALEEEPSVRDSFLAAACADDLSLRDEVDSLLEAHYAATGFMASPTHLGAEVVATPEEAAQVGTPDEERDGATIGPYTLSHVLGEGGFGTVYLASQSKPVRRHVALKVLKPGMDSREVIGRFEAERQALALMDHPNIAKVFDAGTTKSGRPYFVMELVEGLPITKYCDTHNLDTTARLKLFQRVCLAIQHAHQKGVIHRDIKPNNVLVSQSGEKPAPKVIDFGIAKATEARLTDETIVTQKQQLVGTPQYMAPEQLDLFSNDIDTRADIYSLGVLLYELLTGETPVKSESLRGMSFVDAQKLIQEKDPPRPSSRIGQAPEAASIAAHRGVSRGKLSKRLRGDIDWIVMRALEKDRKRRYESAAALSRDIGRHLTGDPCLAGPPTTAYRFKKFAKRHKGLLGAGGAVAAALVLGLGLALVEFNRANVARNAAVAAEQDAITQRDLAEQARQSAESSLAQAEEVTAFLTEMLNAASPYALGRDVLVRDVLDAAGARMDEFSNRPLVEAQLRQTLGTTYRELGAYEEAGVHLVQAHALYREHLGDRHTLTIATLREVAANQQAVEQVEEAERTLRAALALNPNEELRLQILEDLAYNMRVAGKLEDSEKLYRQVLDGRRKLLGDSHIDVAAVMINLGMLYSAEGLAKYDEAEPLLIAGFNLTQELLGPEHPNTIRSLHNLAALYEDMGRFEEALPLMERDLVLAERVFGAEHDSTLKAINNLAVLYSRMDRFDDAERMHTRNFETCKSAFGADHPNTLRAMHNYADMLSRRGKAEEALPLRIELVGLMEQRYGRETFFTFLALSALSDVYNDLGRYVESEPVATEALEIGTQVFPEGHWRMGVAHVRMGECLLGLARLDGAEAQFTAADTMLAAYGPAQKRFWMRAVNGLLEIAQSHEDVASVEAWSARLAEVESQ